MAHVVESDARAGEILDAAAEFFSEYLWTTEIGASILDRLTGEGVNQETIRDFGLGYVPGEQQLVLEHLGRRGYSDAELFEAGIAARSRRGRLHSHFRSRIMFPIRDRDGRPLGFAGMATNPGPSWPLWLTSPDRARFRRRSAIFAIDHAAAAIGEAGRAVVLKDCLEVLQLHERGRREAIAVIRSSVTAEHLGQIAAALDLAPEGVVLEPAEDEPGEVVRPRRGQEYDADGRPAGAETGSSQEPDRSSESELRPDPIKVRSPAARAFVQVARVVLGIGIPLIWLAIVQPDPNFSGGADPVFIGAIAGVAVTYVILTIAGAIAGARIRARSRARRMRGPWEMGATEWQPLAWTYHMLEDILIGAAIVSIPVCTALFVLLGGFSG